MKKPIYILGTGLSHDGSTCLMKDGKIVVAIEKERITKKKHDGFNDNLTVQYCLDAAGIGFKDIDLVVEKCTVNLEHDKDDIQKRKGRIIPKDIPTVKISHHIAHAYSAIGTSPYDEMGIVVMDGRGASLDNCIDINDGILPEEIRKLPSEQKCHYFENQSYYTYENGKMVTRYKDFSKYRVNDRSKYPLSPNDLEHSIAELYGGASQYIFGRDFTEGKLMGLAPYGRKNVYKEDLFIKKRGRVFIDYNVIRKVDPLKSSKYLEFWTNFSYYADIAYWVQYSTEKAVKYLFEYFYNLKPMNNFAYAGGLGLNCVINGKIVSNPKFRNLYIQPAAGDNGLAIGCCYYGWLEVLKKEKVQNNKNTYLGMAYNKQVISASLNKYDKYIIFKKCNDYIKIIANKIAQGEVIGWFQGESEFGPRALGHRSILADPRNKKMKDYINKEIKLREEFRPFAPSVLEEDLKVYFDVDYDSSPYMLLAGNIRKEWGKKLPAVVHIDGSSRIQTVNKNNSEKYYELLNEFKKITKIGILLNTSFNGRNMPIVENPDDAINFFLNSKIDTLVIDDYIIEKRS